MSNRRASIVGTISIPLLVLASAALPLACVSPDEPADSWDEGEASQALDRGNVVAINGLAADESVAEVSGTPEVHDETVEIVDRVVSEDERLRMEEHIDQLYNRDAVVHSFVMPSGDEIDCVDMYEQPALRRPGMQDHRIELAPRAFPMVVADEADVAEPGDAPALQATVPREGKRSMTCPEGSVPIRRLTMETLGRFETLDDFRRKIPGHLLAEERSRAGSVDGLQAVMEPSAIAPRMGSTAFHQYAHAYRVVNNMGAESYLNVWNPYTEQASEFSLSQIWVARGNGDSRETVETGWQKYNDLYGDWNARLFIYFTPDNYGDGGCYNLTCGGFVQTNNTVVIGGTFSDYSVLNGNQYYAKLFWFKDGTDGHWWLKHGDTWVGYYPRTLFDANGLRDNAARIDFGGEILDTEDDGYHTHTDMGSGNFASLGWQQAAYQRNLRYVDTNNFWQQATGLTATYTDYWCYDILLNNSAGSWKTYFYFGGSGYNTYCQ